MMKRSRSVVLGAALLAGGLLAACGDSGGDAPPAAQALTLRVCLDPAIADPVARQKAAQDAAVIAFFDAHEGDTIEFCEGRFEFTNGLVMTGKRGITIKGAGRDKTFLRFKDSTDQDGVNLTLMTGITVQGLTIYDAPGNGLRIFRSDFVTIRDVKVGWSISDPPERGNPFQDADGNSVYNPDPTSWTRNGAYAFYPVLCHKVLIEDSISVGSADAGVYVGQSSDILVRRTEAYHNVAGFEFENTYRAEFVDNLAHDNVGGFLVFDLPGRGQYGEKNLVHHNHSYDNNIPSFAPRGAIVGYVPSGIGMLVFSSDQLELYDNVIENNDTIGLAIVNYGLVSRSEGDRKYDYYPEAIHVYRNTFRDNGTRPQLPNLERSSCNGDPSTPLPPGFPGPSDSPDCVADNASLLPLILVLKNGGRSAQIIWDGGEDPGPDPYCTAYPVDAGGVPLNQPNANDFARYEARFDERGRPNYYIYDPQPACPPPPGQENDGLHHAYNAWKFDAQGQLKQPDNGLCIPTGEHAEANTFELTVPMSVADFANVHFSTADPFDPNNQTPADNEAPMDCPTVPLSLLPQFLPRLGSFTPNPANDPRPSDAERDAVCNAGKPGQVNHAALARYNCPRLDQYGLFADAADPTRDPNGFSVPFELNTILFSDYALKYRFLFLPPSGANAAVPEKAKFQDHETCTTLAIYDCYTATLDFPVGTVFAKTFSFKDGEAEDIVETRLLIKRRSPNGTPTWVGLPYLWTQGPDGERVAVLKIEGATKSVTYDYEDPDPAVGQRYTGAVEHYGVPNAGACLLCHAGDDREAGAAPLGPKVRNLNRNLPGTTQNQLELMQSHGLLDLPAPAAQLERMPAWNVPGSGNADDPALDQHLRARAYLEVNCMHCHNPAGGAQNSGLWLDAFTEPMNTAHGICKTPIAAGRAADIGLYDIQPGNAADSILYERMASNEPGIRMPPLARTVTHGEASSLMGEWIDSVVNAHSAEGDNHCATASDGGGTSLPLGLMPVVPPTPAQTAPWG